MAMSVGDFCRLCAKKDEFSKDLFDESNKLILKLIQDFVQIIIIDSDNLPTKICLNCEEKMVSFQLFVMECYKAQDTLKKLCGISKDENNDSMDIIKLENTAAVLGFPIKSEVKDEMTAEDIVSALNNEGTLSVLEDYNENDTEFDIHKEEVDHIDNNDDVDEDDDYWDNIAIASLKTIKKKQLKKKEITEEQAEEFNQVLQKSNLKVKDLVKLQCAFCDEKLKSWCSLRYHYAKVHKTKPFVYCLCGFAIKSKSVLYKHVSDHKLESRKMKKGTDTDDGETDNMKYSSLNVKDFIRFICPACKKECSSWYSLRAHCQMAHNIETVVTCVCGISLKSKSVMYKHVQDHRNPNILSCDKCPRITKTLSALNKHKMRHIPKDERKFCCSSCEKIFNSRDALKSHEKSHIPIEERKIYHCDLCNMKFTTRSSQASHKRVVHDKIKGYVCDLCGYACGTNGELRQHRAIHSDDKPFVCRTCAKPFKTYSNLKTHMDTHEETKYECYICRRILNSRRTLRKHLLVHEDKCRHVCSYCNKAFKRRQTLKVHMYTHTGDKPLTCKWCDERFSYASTLRSHRMRCHPDKIASQAHHNYTTFQHVGRMPQDYIKDDLVAINTSVAKNEVEAM